jgi:hypothetical protein
MIARQRGIGQSLANLHPADRPYFQSRIFFFKAQRFGERRTSSLGFFESNQMPERDHRTKQRIIFRGAM